MSLKKIIFKIGQYLDSTQGGVIVLQVAEEWFEVYVYEKDWEAPPSEPVFSSAYPREACLHAEHAYVKEFNISFRELTEKLWNEN